MAKDMKAQIKITADGKQAVTALGTVTSGLKKIRSSIFNLKTLIAGGLSTLGITKFAKSIISAGREVEQLETKIDRIAGADAGNKIYRQLNEIAVQTGTTANKLADAWITMANAGVKLSEDSMRSIANVGNVMGEDVYGVISEQLMLIAQTGEITSRQLNAFARAGIDAREILNEAFNLPVDKLKEKGVDAEAVIKALTKGMGDSFKDAANSVGDTWNGIMGSLKAKWQDFKLTIVDSGAFDMFKAGLKAVDDLVGKVFNTDDPDRWAKTITAIAEWGIPLLYKGLTLAARGVLTLVQGFKSLYYVWKSIQTSYYESQANAERAQKEHAQKQVDYLNKQLDGLDKTSGKYKKLAAELEIWQKRLDDATASQDEYNKKAEDGQKQVNELAKSIEAMDEEIERFKKLAAEGSEGLRKILSNLRALNEAPVAFVTKLDEEATKAQQKMALLMVQINAYGARGLKAPTELLEAFTAAQQEALAATLALKEATDYVVNSGRKKKQSGLSDKDIVKPTAPTGSGVDTVKQLALAQAKAQAEMLKLVSEAAVKDLNNLLEDGLIVLKDYYDKRQVELKKQYDAEMAYLDEQLKRTKDKVERLNLEEEKKRRTFTFEVDTADLQREAEKSEAALVKEKMALLKDIELRAQADTLENLRDQRLAALEEQHAEEIELLRQKQATEEEIIQASLNHQLEMEKVKAEESRKIFESQMSTYQTVASNISTAFEAMYDATGESNKAFLAISKAAAIAEAIMNTQVAITKALAEGGPYMGPALAAVAAASGAAAVATIVAQNLATGGVVQGSSPHKRADNIPANLTAGEFVHQVDAVDYYGKDVMQALNQRKIPKTVLQGLMGRVSIPVPPSRGNRFSQGGQVTQISTAGGGNTGGQTLELTIVNVVDPKVVDDYMASNNGKARLLNVVGQSSNQFKQVMEL